MNKEVVCNCSDFVVCATGSTDRLNPFGPFNVDYQVCTPNTCCTFLALPELRPRLVTAHHVTHLWCSCPDVCKTTPSFCTHIPRLYLLLGTGSLSAAYTVGSVLVNTYTLVVFLPQKKYGAQGTRNLVAAAMQAKVKKFVLVTSIGTDDPLFPLNLLFGVRLMPFLLHAVSAANVLAPMVDRHRHSLLACACLLSVANKWSRCGSKFHVTGSNIMPLALCTRCGATMQVMAQSSLRPCRLQSSKCWLFEHIAIARPRR